MEHNLLLSLADNTPDLIYAKDVAGRFLFVNSAIARMAGVQSEHMIGKTDFDFYPHKMAQGFHDDDQMVIRSGQALIDREELVADSETGEARWHSTTKVPLRDDTGATVGILGITRDITASKKTQERVAKLNAELERRVAERTVELQELSEALACERNLMRALVDAMPDNIFAKDTDSRFLLANKWVARGMGTTPGNLLGKSDFNFYPEELAQRFYADEQMILRTGEPLLDRDEPVLDKETGRFRWLLTSKVPVRNSNGEITGLVGIGRDITARREAEMALRESEERFRSLTELSSDWYWEQDEHLRFVELADANAFSAYSGGLIIGKTLQELPDTILLSGSWHEYSTLMAKREPFRDLEFKRVLPTGEVAYFSLSGLPIVAGDGRLLGYRGLGRDITDRKLAEERITYLATHDSLTGLPNRVMFSEMLSRAVSTAARKNTTLAVLFIDLDQFKQINDSLGHDAGDELLRCIAARLQKSLRGSDVVGRLGGDEFVVLVDELREANQAAGVAEKLLAATVEPVTILGREHRVTASIGICLCPHHGTDEQTLMKKADIAMYCAKNSGKNRFAFYAPEKAVNQELES